MKENVWNETKNIFIYDNKVSRIIIKKKKIRKRNKNSSYKRNKCQLINAWMWIRIISKLNAYITILCKKNVFSFCFSSFCCYLFRVLFSVYLKSNNKYITVFQLNDMQSILFSFFLFDSIAYTWIRLFRMLIASDYWE